MWTRNQIWQPLPCEEQNIAEGMGEGQKSIRKIKIRHRTHREKGVKDCKPKPFSDSRLVPPGAFLVARGFDSTFISERILR